MSSCKLFDGISETQRAHLAECMRPAIRDFEKGETVIMEGDRLSQIGIVLSGTLEAKKVSAYGDSVIISTLSEGDVVGEALCASGMESPVTVFASSPCRLAFISFARIMSVCSDSCAFHRRLIENLIRILSLQYFLLHERISCLMLKSLRNKVLEFLLLCSKKAQSDTFNIPFDREEMANFLGCDRSALSRELSALKNEGIIDYYKNSFKITKKR